MKNFKLSILIAFVAIGSFLITSCGPTEEPIKAGPTLNFLAGTGYTSGDVTVPIGTTFKVGLSAQHDSKIEKLKVSVSVDGGAAVTPNGCTACDSSIGKESFTMDFSNQLVGATAGVETWSFTVNDKNGLSTTKTITFTRTQLPKPIVKIDLTVGTSKSTTLGSSINFDDFLVHLLKDAKPISNMIDLCCVVHETDGTILCAPSSSVAADLLVGANGVSTWATRNATKIRKTTITAAQFDNMQDSKELIVEMTSSATTADKVINIASGQVYYIGPVSASGRKALVKINSIDVDNTVTVKILVEKD